MALSKADILRAAASGRIETRKAHSDLSTVYCHHLVSESPPDELWAFDKTVQWRWKSSPRRNPSAFPSSCCRR